MLFRIDPGSQLPIFEQVASCVRAEMASGRLAAGEKLPPAREVAAGLDVNVHTVLRAYQQLRDEELIDLRRGRGAVVTAAAPVGAARLRQLARQIADEARRQGVDRTGVVRLIEGEMP